MIEDGPLLTVVIPVYNGAATIATAIGSVDSDLAEVVVVDDGSSDDLTAALTTLSHPRLRVVRQEQQGPAAARNRGAAEAQGAYLTFVDADDSFLGGALDRYLAVLDDETPLVRAAQVVNLGESSSVRAAVPEPPGIVPRGATASGSFAVSAALYAAVGGYDRRLGFGENTELLLRLVRACHQRGANIGFLESAAVLVHRDDAATRTRRYGNQPAITARHILRTYPEEMANDSAIRHDYHSIIGTDLQRSGHQLGAIVEFGRAVRAEPRSARGWARLARSLVPIPRR